MMTSREQRIRMLAYRLWESEGRPEGQEARHWEMAERIVEAENAREEEQEWQGATDEPSLFEGEDPPAEPDELGIDEQRLPLDDPETEARKEADTGVEVHPAPERAKATPKPKPKPRAKPAAEGKKPASEGKKPGAAKKPAAGAKKPGVSGAEPSKPGSEKPPARPRKKPDEGQ